MTKQPSTPKGPEAQDAVERKWFDGFVDSVFDYCGNISPAERQDAKDHLWRKITDRVASARLDSAIAELEALSNSSLWADMKVDGDDSNIRGCFVWAHLIQDRVSQLQAERKKTQGGVDA